MGWAGLGWAGGGVIQDLVVNDAASDVADRLTVYCSQAHMEMKPWWWIRVAERGAWGSVDWGGLGLGWCGVMSKVIATAGSSDTGDRLTLECCGGANNERDRAGGFGRSGWGK